MAYENFDAGPLIEKLRRLGVDLQREAQARIEAAAMQAYTRVTGQYPVRSGNLRAGLTWGRGLARSGGGVMYGASGVLIALREIEMNGGKGQVIDLPLLDPLFAVLGPQAANYRLTGKVRPRTGSRSTNAAPRNAYHCKDGKYVGLSAWIQKMAEGVFRSIGRPDLIDNPRYRTNADRVQHAAELDEIIGAFVAQRTQAENVAFFEQAEVTIGPIYDISQIVEDPHVLERELIADYPDPDMGLYPMHHVVPGTFGRVDIWVERRAFSTLWTDRTHPER